MKKSLFLIGAVCAAAASLSACNVSCGDNKTEFGYDDLNGKINLNYSKIEISVTDKFSEDVSLVSKYTLINSDSETKVSYTVQRFASISLSGSTATGAVETVKGEVVYSNGKVVAGDIGIAADIPETGLNFKAEYFENASITEKAFSADVKDANGFMGVSKTCTDMKVSASYLNAFTSIKITFSAQNGNAVEYKYEYTV